MKKRPTKDRGLYTMAIQNPRELHNGQVTESITEPPRADGQPNTHHQIIKRKKLLYIILYYWGDGASGKYQMKNSGAFKANRLRYGNFSGFSTSPPKDREVKLFEIYQNKDFQETWTKVYNLANQDNYTLQEVHIFAHGAHNSLYMYGETFTIDLVKTLETLPFGKTGALVLHTCRGGRYEDNSENDERDASEKCIARAFAEHLNIKVIGQMTGANFTIAFSLEDCKYCNFEFVRRMLSVGASNAILWGYKMGTEIKRRDGDKPDYQILADGQLWSARVFYGDGREIYSIGKDMFNDSDLKYI